MRPILNDLGSVGPRAISAAQAFKNMSEISAFSFHERFDERELMSAQAAIVI